MAYPTPNTSLKPTVWLPNYDISGDDIIIGQLSDFPTLTASKADGSTGKIQSVTYSIVESLYRQLLNNVNGTTTSQDVFYITKTQNSTDLNNILTAFNVTFKMRVATTNVNGTLIQGISPKSFPPTSVTDLSATSNTTTGDIDLTWTVESTSDARQYLIYRLPANDVPPSIGDTPIATVTAPATSYSDTDTGSLSVGNTYYYWIVTKNSQFYSGLSTDTGVLYEGVSGVAYSWTGGVLDGILGTDGNYFPGGIPTSIDTVYFNSTYISPPLSGSLTCLSATVDGVDIAGDCTIVGTVTFINGAINYGAISVGIFEDTSHNDISATVTDATFNGTGQSGGSGSVAVFNGETGNYGAWTTMTFNGASYNNSLIQNATFKDSSFNSGGSSVENAVFIPTFENDAWTYPTNEGAVNNSICYWPAPPEGPTLGGTKTNPPDYQGYPVPI